MEAVRNKFTHLSITAPLRSQSATMAYENDHLMSLPASALPAADFALGPVHKRGPEFFTFDILPPHCVNTAKKLLVCLPHAERYRYFPPGAPALGLSQAQTQASTSTPTALQKRGEMAMDGMVALSTTSRVWPAAAWVADLERNLRDRMVEAHPVARAYAFSSRLHGLCSGMDQERGGSPPAPGMDMRCCYGNLRLKVGNTGRAFEVFMYDQWGRYLGPDALSEHSDKEAVEALVDLHQAWINHRTMTFGVQLVVRALRVWRSPAFLFTECPFPPSTPV